MATPGNTPTDSGPPFCFGNAARDQIRGTGWFVGQFVPPELGLRHQSDVELKWGVHADGEKRVNPWATGHATTISILIEGMLTVTLHLEDRLEVVALRQPGDYIAFGPLVVHSWQATGHTIVLSVRFPSVEISRAQP